MIAAYYKRLTSSDQVFLQFIFTKDQSTRFNSQFIRKCDGLPPRSGVCGRWGPASLFPTRLILTRWFCSLYYKLIRWLLLTLYFTSFIPLLCFSISFMHFMLHRPQADNLDFAAAFSRIECHYFVNG